MKIENVDTRSLMCKEVEDVLIDEKIRITSDFKRWDGHGKEVRGYHISCNDSDNLPLCFVRLSKDQYFVYQKGTEKRIS